MTILHPKKIEYIHFDTIDSTNTWAKNHAATLNPHHITCITASEQTAGRGRYTRTWLSPKDQNIYITFFFCIPKDAPYIGNIPQILALAALHTLKECALSGQIKWPNDLLIDKKKVGGILCEAITLEKRLGIALGLGLNINMPQNLLSTIDRPATSLLAETGRTRPIQEVQTRLISHFTTLLPTLQKEGIAPFIQELQSALAYQGETVTLQVANNTYVGTVVSLNSQGHLILHLSTGEQKTFSTGEMGT